MNDQKTQEKTEGATRRFADATRSAMMASRDLMAISMRCGHVVPIEDATEGQDKYFCPICGLRFHVEQDPPKRYPNGFVIPGDRHIVIDAQGKSPNKELTDRRGAGSVA